MACTPTQLRLPSDLVRLALGLAGVLLVFAPSRAMAQEACDPTAPQPELFTNAIGECDEPGQPSVEQPLPAREPVRAPLPLTCDDGSCAPQRAPVGTTGSYSLSFSHPLAVLGTTVLDPEPQTFIVTNDAAGPRAGFCPRIERPPRSF